MKTVGAYEAKTHLPELLERVSMGEKIVITRHGVPVAILQPADSSRRRTARDAIDRLKQFHRGKKLDGLSIRDLIEEGRSRAGSIRH